MLADKMHVTMVYSKSPVDRAAAGVRSDAMTVGQEGRAVERPDDGTIVLRIDSPELQARWRETIDAGATWNLGRYDGDY